MSFSTIAALVTAYCDSRRKSKLEPLPPHYLGKEMEAIEKLRRTDYFACVGHNGSVKINPAASAARRSHQCDSPQRAVISQSVGYTGRAS